MIVPRLLALPVALAVLGAAGCAGPPPARGPSGAVTAAPGAAVTDSVAVAPTDGNVARPDSAHAFSTADVEFLASMVNHHTATQPMLELGERRAGAPAVRDFCASTLSAQQHEIDQMQRWLAALGVDPSTVGDAHDHGGAPPRPDAADLRRLSGPAFDERFLDVLGDHSVSAVSMANEAAKDGFNDDVRRLAAAIALREWSDLETIRHLR